MGVDFGSGISSVTAIAILIWWRKSDRFQLVHIEKRPQENQLKQAEHIVNLFREYSCDIGVGDLGYGANQVKLIQDGGNFFSEIQLKIGSEFYTCLLHRL